MTGSLTRPIADGALAAPRHRVGIRDGWVSAARMQVIVALAIVPVGVSAIWLAVASEHVERPAATALYRCYLAVVPLLIGLPRPLRRRRRRRRVRSAVRRARRRPHQHRRPSVGCRRRAGHRHGRGPRDARQRRAAELSVRAASGPRPRRRRYLADRLGLWRGGLRYGCRPAARWIGLAAVAPASGVGGPGRSNRSVGPFEAVPGRGQPAAEPAESSASSASLSNSWRGTSPHSASRR
jgi:hypothetical protein